MGFAKEGIVSELRELVALQVKWDHKFREEREIWRFCIEDQWQRTHLNASHCLPNPRLADVGKFVRGSNHLPGSPQLHSHFCHVGILCLRDLYTQESTVDPSPAPPLTKVLFLRKPYWSAAGSGPADIAQPRELPVTRLPRSVCNMYANGFTNAFPLYLSV